MWKRPSSSPDVGFEAFLCFYFKIKLSEKHISNLRQIESFGKTIEMQFMPNRHYSRFKTETFLQCKKKLYVKSVLFIVFQFYLLWENSVLFRQNFSPLRCLHISVVCWYLGHALMRTGFMTSQHFSPIILVSLHFTPMKMFVKESEEHLCWVLS